MSNKQTEQFNETAEEARVEMSIKQAYLIKKSNPKKRIMYCPILGIAYKFN